MILMERDIAEEDLEVRMDWIEDTSTVEIQIIDKNTRELCWQKDIIGDGKLALEIFYHPYFYGFGLER